MDIQVKLKSLQIKWESEANNIVLAIFITVGVQTFASRNFSELFWLK